MKKVLLLSVIASFLFAAPAIAQQEGPYVGFGLTYVNFLSSDFRLDTIDPSIGLELRLGYRLRSIAFEGNFIGSTHNDDFPGFSDADFSAANFDVRFFFSQPRDYTQPYFLFGVGAYSVEQTDLVTGEFFDFEGSGLNVGIGFEHFFNQRMALDIRGVFRFIEYDLDVNGARDANNIDGDTFTLGAALNFHF